MNEALGPVPDAGEIVATPPQFAVDDVIVPEYPFSVAVKVSAPPAPLKVSPVGFTLSGCVAPGATTTFTDVL